MTTYQTALFVLSGFTLAGLCFCAYALMQASRRSCCRCGREG